MTSIAVIGGGISGLSTALEVRRLNPGIPNCIRSGRNAAKQLVSKLAARPRSAPAR